LGGAKAPIAVLLLLYIRAGVVVVVCKGGMMAILKGLKVLNIDGKSSIQTPFKINDFYA